MICPNCGKDFKNLGVHQRFCGTQGAVVDHEKTNLIVDNYMGKSLSLVIEDIEKVLKSMSCSIDTKVSKDDGVVTNVELIIRIPIRR